MRLVEYLNRIHFQGTPKPDLETLKQLKDKSWRFHNHEHGFCKSFDFFFEPANEQLLNERCQWLSTSPESPFQKTHVAFIYTRTGYNILFGRQVQQVTKTGFKQWIIKTPSDFNDYLNTNLLLKIEDHHILWDKAIEHWQQERRYLASPPLAQ